MNNREENKYTMYQAVLTILDQNRDTVNSNPVLKQIKGNFDTHVQSISSINEKYLAGSQGQVEKKHRIEDELIDEANDLASALKLYGIMNQLDELRVFSTVTESSLRALRDTEVSEKAKSIANELRKYRAQLVDYGVSQKRNDDFFELANTYEAAIGDAEAASAEKEASRKELTFAFQKTDETLNESLDSILEVFSKDHPDFYNRYKEARTIKNLGKRNEDEQPAEMVNA